MTALWSPGIENGDGYGDGDGFGTGWVDGFGDGYGNGRGGGSGHDWGDNNGDNWDRGNGDGHHGYPEQTYNGCTAINRLRMCEAVLPVADLLTLAVTR